MQTITNRRKAIDWWHTLSVTEQKTTISKWKESNSVFFQKKWSDIMISSSSSTIEIIYNEKFN